MTILSLMKYNDFILERKIKLLENPGDRIPIEVKRDVQLDDPFEQHDPRQHVLSASAI